ncbi:Trp biosynthesis-associated membrane protein [Actinokineospora sp. HUAS TT18]|uniref:Trp biosynthesis-associated membrane protein n=1 Tax=Actinokineospora sp. HUAS TT18 TaxID=3447451 RepID=UPI003F520480
MADPAKRPLWTICGLLPLAALALWGAARLDWGAVPALPALVPLALLDLAAVAAVLALGPVPRRLVGLMVAGLGVMAVVLSVGTPFLWGRALAVTGGALMVAAGILLLLRGHRLPRLGAKYAAPGAAADSEPDLWRALSEGDDPTAR